MQALNSSLPKSGWRRSNTDPLLRGVLNILQREVIPYASQEGRQQHTFTAEPYSFNSDHRRNWLRDSSAEVDHGDSGFTSKALTMKFLHESPIGKGQGEGIHNGRVIFPEC